MNEVRIVDFVYGGKVYQCRVLSGQVRGLGLVPVKECGEVAISFIPESGAVTLNVVVNEEKKS